MATLIGDMIIKRAQKGDIRAFEQIVHGYEKRIYYFAIKYTNSSADAEDIVQEVFIKLYKNIGKYNFVYRFSTWLFSIAKNKIYDFLRKQRTKKEVNFSQVQQQFLDNYHEESRVSLGEKIDLALALRQIKPIYEKILTLFYLEGFNYSEIAQYLDMPLNTVKTYIFRAKNSIRLALS